MLSMECDKDLEEGKNPGPLVEIEFWEAKCRNLESLFEQVDQYSKALVQVQAPI